MSDNPDPDRLKALEQRIGALKKTQEPAPPKETHYEQAHLAWRMVLELVVGLLIGLGIGWGLDAAFGTRPIFLVLFILLGFAAGVNVMMRTAKEVQKNQVARAAKENEKKRD